MENQSIEKEVKPKKENKNPWLLYVKELREKHSDKPYKEILQLAKESYVKVEKPVKAKKAKIRKDKEDA